MKNLFCLLLLAVLAISCKASQMTKSVWAGTYIAAGKDYNYRLLLNNDNTFQLNFQGLEANSGCEGKWELKNKDLIVLTCNEPKVFTEALQSGYMTVRIQELKIKSEKELIYNGITLKKTN